MSALNGNHYEVLGVERTADERAVKKAYFALVRKYPPETHPEEFKRLREAYEVLSNAEARKAYDAEDRSFGEYGADAGGKLGEAQAAMSLEDWPRAVALLEPLVEEQPDTHLARDMLVVAYLNAGEKGKALAAAQQLIAMRDDVWSYQLHYGWALDANDAMTAALAAFRKAIELAPKEGGPHAALIDRLAQAEKWEEAVEAARAARAALPEELLSRAHFTLREVRFRFKQKRAPVACAVLDELIAGLPADADEDLRKFLVQRMCNVAAELFANGRSEDANLVLERCQRVHPATGACPLPLRLDLPLADLPEGSRAALLHGPTNGRASLDFGSGRASTPMLAASAVVLVLALGFAFGRREAWEGLTVLLALVLTGAFSFAAWASRQFLNLVATPEMRHVAFLTELWLVELEEGRVVAYPLVSLADINVTHRSTNGSYSHSNVDVRFGWVWRNFNVKGTELAVKWAQAIADGNRHALQLLAGGLVDESEDAKLLPRSVLDLSRRAKPPVVRSWKRFAWAGGVAAAVVITFVLSLALNGARVAEARYVDAMRSSGTEVLAAYAAAHTGPRAEEAANERARRVEEAVTRCTKSVHPFAEGEPDVLCRLLAGFVAGGSPAVAVGATVSVTPPPEGLVQPHPVADADAVAGRAGTVLGAAFRDLVGPSFVRVSYGSPATSGARLVVAASFVPDGVLAAPKRGKYAAYALEADVELAGPDGRTLLSFHESVPPPASLAVADPHELAPYHAMGARLLDELGRRLAKRLGVDEETGREVVAVAPKASSPYGTTVGVTR